MPTLLKHHLYRIVIALLLLATSVLMGDIATHGAIAWWMALGIPVAYLAVLLVSRDIAIFTTGIFLLLILGEALGDRSFSHFIIGKPPLYVTEVGMFIVAVLLLVQKKLSMPRSVRDPLAAIMLVCILAALINLHKNPAMSVLRDSAELYYMLFIPISYSVCKLVWPRVSRQLLERMVIVLGYVAPLFFLATYTIQIAAASEAFSASLILFEMSWKWRWVKMRYVWISVVLNLASLADGGGRGPWIGFFAGLTLLVWFSNRPQRLLANGHLRQRLYLFMAIVVTSCVMAFLIDPRIVTHIGTDLGSVMAVKGSYFQVNNNRWRLIIWSEAFHQFWSNPLAIRVGQNWMPATLTAMGYGGLNTTGYGLNTVTLSNSYLQMLQWYGLWAFVPFCWLVARIFKPLVADLRSDPVVLSMASVLLVWAINCGVEVVLEGPYMSAVIWTLVGFSIAYLEGRKVPNAHGR